LARLFTRTDLTLIDLVSQAPPGRQADDRGGAPGEESQDLRAQSSKVRGKSDIFCSQTLAVLTNDPMNLRLVQLYISEYDSRILWGGKIASGLYTFSIEAMTLARLLRRKASYLFNMHQI